MPTKTELKMTINGQERKLSAYPMERLLDVIREEAALTGTKEGCGEGECGACSVIIDGKLVNSCLVPFMQADGAKITTIEGLAQNGQLSPMQQAFLECGGAQCGICTPGMVLAATQLVEEKRSPCLPEIREALAGNLCRCTGYRKIFESVLAATQQPKDCLHEGVCSPL